MTQDPDRIDILVDQVARLTEGITELRLSHEESHQAMRSEIHQSHQAIMTEIKESHHAVVTEIKESHQAIMTEIRESHHAAMTEIRESHCAAMTEIKESHRASMEKFDRLWDVVQRQSHDIDRMANEITATARQQAQTVDRLIQMMATK